ncbi:hypothetical protein ACFWIJ_42750, partial [Streptomyces sp. NPDC127079]
MHADPAAVVEALEAGAASSPAARLVRALYQESSSAPGGDAGLRRQLLALDAARFGDRKLAARISSVAVEGEADALWTVEWATSSMIVLTYRDTLPGHTDTVHSVSFGTVDGRDVVVTAGWDKTVCVRDLADGRPFGEPGLPVVTNDGRH